MIRPSSLFQRSHDVVEGCEQTRGSIRTELVQHRRVCLRDKPGCRVQTEAQLVRASDS